ncbi:hypothetical protein KBB68_03895 [Candidatus Babeliales bacterium]|nr:hypothetical protein [Candidatus Babeliales bacterium]
MSTQDSIGFFGKIQQSIDAIFASLHISARDVILYVTCFGIGFLLGIGFKRYGKWIVAILLGAMIIIAGLHYFEFITVHQEKLLSILGLSDVHTIRDVTMLLQEKMQKFLIEIVLLCIAIIVGFKLG